MKYDECLKVLRESNEIIRKGVLEICVKPVPETDEPGAVDPRESHWFRVKPTGPNIKDPNNLTPAEIHAIRTSMGCVSIDLSHGITTDIRVITTEAGDLPILIYTPSGSKTPKPVVVYIHGGGFFGGTARVIENACKALAGKADAVVVSVDYELAPEHKFPFQLNQCYQTVRWVHAHASELGIDPEKIAVSGDSAGGNLSAACCVIDREKLIKLQLLLYPAAFNRTEEELGWSLEQYDLRENVEIKMDFINDIRNMVPFTAALYVESPEHVRDPRFSVGDVEDYSCFPSTFIAVGEYDYLRIQDELFGQKLAEAGIPVRFVRYKGMAHAFWEHTGEFPQAEDCTEEMAKLIRGL
jgi:acetyl esterase/lipase